MGPPFNHIWGGTDSKYTVNPASVEMRVIRAIHGESRGVIIRSKDFRQLCGIQEINSWTRARRRELAVRVVRDSRPKKKAEKDGTSATPRNIKSLLKTGISQYKRRGRRDLFVLKLIKFWEPFFSGRVWLYRQNCCDDSGVRERSEEC